MDFHRSELIASYNTLSGVLGLQPARHGFRERVAAAADARFDGIGLATEDYAALRAAGCAPQEIVETLEEHRVRVSEVEFLRDWAQSDTLDDESVAREQTIAEMAALFGARHVNVGDFGAGGTLPDGDLVARRLAALADRMDAQGLIVALEFWPMGSIANLEQAWGLVQAADRPNLGILIDSWHYRRGGERDEVLRTIPPDRIVGIQLADADTQVVGSLWDDTMERRKLPGEGDLDLESFLQALDKAGVNAPLAVEVISTEQAALTAETAAKRAADSTRALLDRAALRSTPRDGRSS